MIPFAEMNALLRAAVCFWTLLLILGYTVNIFFSVRQKRYFYAGLTLITLCILYYIMQIIHDISRTDMGMSAVPYADTFGSLPFIIYIVILSAFTIAFIIQYHSNLTYAKTHISSMSVKEALDKNPTGICYYRENGQLILSNHKMNALAFSVTGHALLNGTELYDAVKKEPITEPADGTVIRFSHKTLTLSGELCHELIADDITEIYRKSEILQKDNERLKSQNRIMQEYGETIDETVRRQEVLMTKTKIHDEMNRLLLSTDNAICGGMEKEKQQIIETWQKNILLLCIEAGSDTKNNALSDLDALAKLIGMTITYDKLPETEKSDTLLLFSLAAEEAMTNAAKHGGAKNLYVNISETDETLTVKFTNDGKNPDGTVTEGGGLSALRHRLQQAGGSVNISVESRFTLTVSIPKGGNINVL
ncbi:MAG: hypothetical protein MJ177_04255 [Clostridia bacterium]|nr:hypothetical protein [Clostridia bacterium]